MNNELGNSPKRTGQIEQQFNSLAKEMERAESIKCQLMDRLDTVLSQETPHPPTKEDAEKPQLVRQAQVLSDFASRLRSMSEQYEDMFDRIEL